MQQPTPFPTAAAPAWAGTLRLAARALAAAMLAAAGAAQAQAEAPKAGPALVTILDGAAVVLRGSTRLQLAEGVRLAPQDIVETTAEARLLRIEFTDGMALSIGPATRLWIEPRLAGEGRRGVRGYLLRGWIKLNAVPAGRPATALIASPVADLLSTGGSVVASVQDATTGAPPSPTLQVFAETGELSLQERQGGQALGGVQRLRSGEFLGRSGAGKSAVSARPPAEFIAQVPRAFLDTLPARAALFQQREVAPKPLGEPSYPDVQAWLTAEPALRRPAMPRWRPLLRQPDFRRAMIANMAAHPEWDPVLFPEKYAPKPSAPGGGSYPR